MTRFTVAQYDIAIENLTRAKRQLAPDGRNCVLCGDNDHQAFECKLNLLVVEHDFQRLRTHAILAHDELHKVIG